MHLVVACRMCKTHFETIEAFNHHISFLCLWRGFGYTQYPEGEVIEYDYRSAYPTLTDKELLNIRKMAYTYKK